VAESLRRGATAYEVDASQFPDVSVVSWDGLELVLRRGERVIRGAAERRGGRLRVHHEGLVYEFEVVTGGGRSGPAAAAASELHAPMTGTVVEVFVREGETVAAGAPLLIVEALKMEHRIAAPAAARILRLHVGAGDRVDVGAALVSLKIEEPA
jgi:3-methylcrotonyl-CoA carboxylase alpha subunit